MAACAVVLLGAYILFSAWLGERTEGINAQLAGVGVEPLYTAAPAAPSPKSSFRKLLARQIEQGLVGVDEREDGTSVITLTAPELFASASENINVRYGELIAAIGAAAQRVPGRITVIGHTDDQPVRSLRFQDNYELSRARALQVANLLRTKLGEPDRVDFIGKGDSEPRYRPGGSARATGRATGASRSFTGRKDESHARPVQESCRTHRDRAAARRADRLVRRALLRVRGGAPVAERRCATRCSSSQWSSSTRRWFSGVSSGALGPASNSCPPVRAPLTERNDSARATGAETAQLRQRFEGAVDTLKRSRRKGLASLYELPWYIVIGPPGSGKTTVLVNSGLSFPLAQKFGKEALRGVGGTRNCDWWFTDEAVLLDTAGRYTTQDSDSLTDSAGWGAFLKLLCKYRRRQPINGVLVALSAQDLLTMGEKELERHAVAIRERLDELGRFIRIDVPVYLIVTKTDLVAGFTEFFDDLGQAARAQVWGTTFPLALTESGRATEAFGREFDGLIERLQQRVPARLEGERDPRRRGSILAFPRQMTVLRPVLDSLLKRVFSTSEFDRRLLLRGIYLTSGTQEGMPIDRVLGSVARTLGVSANVAPPPGGSRQVVLHRVSAAQGDLPGVGARRRRSQVSAPTDLPAIGGVRCVRSRCHSRAHRTRCELPGQCGLCR